MFVAVILAFTPVAHAAEPGDFFKGKTVRLVTGGGVGGGYDIYLRMMVPYFAKYLGATVVPENRPGAGMMLAMNQIYQAAPDGLTVLLAPGEGAVLGKLMDEPGLRFDLLKYPILARVNTAPRVLIVNPKSPYKTIADVIASPKPVWLGFNGKTDGVADTAAIMCHALKIPCKLAIGYPSSKQFSLAAVKGEVDGTILVDDSAIQFSKDGQLRPVVFTGRERSQMMPDIPTVFEAIKVDDEAAWWLDFRDDLRKLGRLLMVPPGMPPERLQYLRDVSRKILSDPAVMAEFSAKGQPLQYAPPEDMQAIIADMVGTKISKERLYQIRHVILEEFY